MPSTLAQQISQPRIEFTDSLTTGSAVVSSILLPAPKSFSVRKLREVATPRANSGKLVTLKFYDLDEIEITWDLMALGTPTEDGFSDLRRLWDNCNDGTSFKLWRHEALASGYPDPLVKEFQTHRNYWPTVRFSPRMRDFQIANQMGMKDTFQVSLHLEEVK